MSDALAWGFAPLRQDRIRVMDLEQDVASIRELLDAGARDEHIVLVGATARSMPLAVIAARSGCVVGILPSGASCEEVSRVTLRGRADQVEAYRDIARIFAAESRRHPRDAGFASPSK